MYSPSLQLVQVSNEPLKQSSVHLRKLVSVQNSVTKLTLCGELASRTCQRRKRVALQRSTSPCAAFVPTMNSFCGNESHLSICERELELTNRRSQIIDEISVAGATYRAMEFVDTAVAAMTMKERMTSCNMVVEAGGKNGVVPADVTTAKYLEGKTSKPYQAITSDGNASFFQEYRFDVSKQELVVATRTQNLSWKCGDWRN